MDKLNEKLSNFLKDIKKIDPVNDEFSDNEDNEDNEESEWNEDINIDNIKKIVQLKKIFDGEYKNVFDLKEFPQYTDEITKKKKDQIEIFEDIEKYIKIDDSSEKNYFNLFSNKKPNFQSVFKNFDHNMWDIEKLGLGKENKNITYEYKYPYLIFKESKKTKKIHISEICVNKNVDIEGDVYHGRRNDKYKKIIKICLLIKLEESFMNLLFALHDKKYNVFWIKFYDLIKNEDKTIIKRLFYILCYTEYFTDFDLAVGGTCFPLSLYDNNILKKKLNLKSMEIESENFDSISMDVPDFLVYIGLKDIYIQDVDNLLKNIIK